VEYFRHPSRTAEQLELLGEGELIILAAIDDLNAAVQRVADDVAALVAKLSSAEPDLSGAISSLGSAADSAEAVLNPPAVEPAPAEEPAA
jgi:hypothetical protein